MSSNEPTDANDTNERRPIRKPTIVRGRIRGDAGQNEDNWFGKLNTKIQTEIPHEHEHDNPTD